MVTLYDGKGVVEILDDTIAALQLRWPTRNVQDELLKAHLWLLRHPARRPANIWRFIDHWLEKAPAVKRPPPVVEAWWTTNERIVNQGAAVGLRPRAGESWTDFKDRVSDKLRAA